MNPNPNQDNLVKFKKGTSGNPKGRAKGLRPTKTILSEFFNTNIDWNDIEGKPKVMKAINAMHLEQIKKAFKGGDTTAYKAIMERFEGMPKQETQTTMTFQKMPTIVDDKTGEEMRFDCGEDPSPASSSS